ncbi:MAG: hypothetical protein LBO69_02815 [Ignavibacteria bacterium]|jgi:photosystem II stability/assembly factor-like uncharacterized protein|nr:hypothetical protein [Ignavibacteria bacterium]
MLFVSGVMQMRNKLITIITFLSLTNALLAVDWSDYLWIEAKVTPEMLTNTYWLEFSALPGNPRYMYSCGNYGNSQSNRAVFAKSNDSGKTWNAKVVSESMHAESVHFVDSNVGYMSGSNKMLKTTDGGETWKRLNVETSNYVYIEMVWGSYAMGNSVWVIGGNCSTGTQRFWHSKDGGQTWNCFQTKVSVSTLSDIVMYEEFGLGYAIGSGIVWKTTNGGDTWQIHCATPDFYWYDNVYGSGSTDTVNINWHEDIAIYNQSILIPASPGCSGGGSRHNGGMAFSTDMGMTWKTFNTKSDMFGTFLVNDSSGWACGTESELYFTTDYGKNWIKMICGVKDHTNFDDIYFINDSVGFVTGDGGMHRLIRRSDTISVIGDTLLCIPHPVTLSASNYFNYYEWYRISGKDTILVISTTENSIDVNKAGNYIVKGVNYNCYAVTSSVFTVVQPDIPDIVIKTDKPYYCFGDSAIIEIDPAVVSQIEALAEAGLILKDVPYDLRHGYETKDGLIYKIYLYNINTTDVTGYFFWKNEFGCTDTIKFTLDIAPYIKPILKPVGNMSFCVGEEHSIKFENAYMFSDYDWYNDSGIVASNVPEIDVSNLGVSTIVTLYYYVIASVDGRCPVHSDTQKVVVRNDSNRIYLSDLEIPFFIDSVAFGFQGYRYLQLHNTCSEEYTIEQVYFANKYAFTAPQSQFPITIQPYGTALLLIYFTPTDLDLQEDTLYLLDNCSTHFIPLSAFSKKGIDSAEGLCNTIVTITTRSANVKKIMTLTQPMPNPTSTMGKIVYQITADAEDNFANNFVNDIKVITYDMLGREIDIPYNVKSMAKTQENEIGEITYNLQNVNSGVYFMRIVLDDAQHLFILNK